MRNLKEIFEKLANFLGLVTYSRLNAILAGMETHSVEDTDATNLEKRKLFEFFLREGIAHLHFDARVDGVCVPDDCKNQQSLVLSFSYRYNIADFEFDDKQVVATLSFRGRPFRCVIPWSAVYAIGDAKNQIVTDQGELKETEQPKKNLTPEARRRNFRVIQGGKR